MCRSIKTLRVADQPATREEIRAASLQFVRKVSGFRHPSQRHQQAFERAVEEIEGSCERLLQEIAVNMRSG